MLLTADCSSAESIAIHIVIITRSQDAFFMSCSELCASVKVLVYGNGNNGKHQNNLGSL